MKWAWSKICQDRESRYVKLPAWKGADMTNNNKQ